MKRSDSSQDRCLSRLPRLMMFLVSALHPPVASASAGVTSHRYYPRIFTITIQNINFVFGCLFSSPLLSMEPWNRCNGSSALSPSLSRELLMKTHPSRPMVSIMDRVVSDIFHIFLNQNMNFHMKELNPAPRFLARYRSESQFLASSKS